MHLRIFELLSKHVCGRIKTFSLSASHYNLEVDPVSNVEESSVAEEAAVDGEDDDEVV